MQQYQLDKNITDHINLLCPVALNKVRSYRDGNLMLLNFSVIDSKGEQLFSISAEMSRYASDGDSIMEAVNDPEMGNFDAFELANFLYYHAQKNNWYPDLSKEELQKKFNQNLVDAVLAYYSATTVLAMQNIIENLDFFSLQTKEEFEIRNRAMIQGRDDLEKRLVETVKEANEQNSEEAKMHAYVTFSLIKNAAVLVPQDWGEEMQKDFKENMPEYSAWFKEEYQRMFCHFSEKNGLEI